MSEGHIAHATPGTMPKQDCNEGLQSTSLPIHAFAAFSQQMASFPVDMFDLFVGDYHTLPQVLLPGIATPETNNAHELSSEHNPSHVCCYIMVGLAIVLCKQ
jgi:hypothetical protein